MSSIMLKNVRLSFPVLFTPEEFEKGDGKPRFGCALLIKKDDPQLAKVKAAIRAAGEEKWGKKFDAIRKADSFKLHALRDGDATEYDGYEGCMFVSANRAANRGAPRIIDRVKVDGHFPPLTEADGRPYAGCYVNAKVDFYGDTRFGKALNAGLVAVQFWADGEAFAGGSRFDEDEFEENTEAMDEADDEEPVTEGADEEDEVDPLA